MKKVECPDCPDVYNAQSGIWETKHWPDCARGSVKLGGDVKLEVSLVDLVILWTLLQTVARKSELELEQLLPVTVESMSLQGFRDELMRKISVAIDGTGYWDEPTRLAPLTTTE